MWLLEQSQPTIGTGDKLIADMLRCRVSASLNVSDARSPDRNWCILLRSWRSDFVLLPHHPPCETWTRLLSYHRLCGIDLSLPTPTTCYLGHDFGLSYPAADPVDLADDGPAFAYADNDTVERSLGRSCGRSIRQNGCDSPLSGRQALSPAADICFNEAKAYRRGQHLARTVATRFAANVQHSPALLPASAMEETQSHLPDQARSEQW